MSVKVSASILGIDYSNTKFLKGELEKIETAGVDYVHFDVCDGKFVDTTSFDCKFIKKTMNLTNLPADVHLMVQDIKPIIKDYIDIKPQNLTVQFETMKQESLIEILKMITNSGINAGLAIKPTTETDELKEIIKLNKKERFLNHILVLSVVPGRSGQKFIEGTEKKLSQLKKLDENLILEIDGGVNEANAKMLQKFGADILVSGSTIFSSKDVKQTVLNLKLV